MTLPKKKYNNIINNIMKNSIIIFTNKNIITLSLKDLRELSPSHVFMLVQLTKVINSIATVCFATHDHFQPTFTVHIQFVYTGSQK